MYWVLTHLWEFLYKALLGLSSLAEPLDDLFRNCLSISIGILNAFATVFDKLSTFVVDFVKLFT